MVTETKPSGTEDAAGLADRLAAALQEAVGHETGCRSAILIDLAAGLPLACASSGDALEEEADLAAAAAVELLDTAEARDAAGSGADDGAPSEALVAADRGIAVVRRSSEMPERALWLLFDPGSDLAQARASARRTMERVAAILPF